MKTKTILITWASGWIGKEIAELAAKDWHTLILVARSHETLMTLKKQREELYSSQIHIFSYDLTKQDNIHSLLSDLDEKRLIVDTLINNAWFWLSWKFIDSDFWAVRRMMQLNMMAVVELTQKLLPGICRHRGHILNVASTAAFQPIPGMTTYAATKAFVYSRSRALWYEEPSISVTTLCPWPTKTWFADQAGLGKSKLFESAMDVKIVAKQWYEGMWKKKTLVIPGRQNRVLRSIGELLPDEWKMKIADKLIG